MSHRIAKLQASGPVPCRSPRLRVSAVNPRGYTLIEILVVSAISLILMTVIAYIYTQSLQVYQESQGLATVYETAKAINRDMRNTLGYCVPVAGNRMNPQTFLMPGGPGVGAPIPGAGSIATPNQITLPGGSPSTMNTIPGIDPWYLDTNTFSTDGPNKAGWMANDQTYDLLFSGSQFRMKTSGDSGLYKGYPSSLDDMEYQLYSYYFYAAAATPKSTNGNYGLRSYWMPAFFGRRDFASMVTTSSGSKTQVFGANDILAGSWGWPRPDYRVDVDLDRTPTYLNGDIIGLGGVTTHHSSPLSNSTAGNPTIACWFYAEKRAFNSPYTLALDNANVMLVSFKFSWIPAQPATVVAGVPVPAAPEQTQLSILGHSVVGFDVGGGALLRSDETTGNMLRAFKVKPYCIEGGVLTEMKDAELNSTQTSGAAVAKIGANPVANLVPKFFDIEYSLRNPYSQNRYDFALRVYCPVNPQ